MIKISSLISLSKFSTIRFPEYYNKVFQLNNQIRSCITLTDLQTFVHEHDEDIKKYAKVSILQYLNEFPTSFNLPVGYLEIYYYVLTLDNLNIYEQQLKHANLIKLLQYSGKEAFKLKEIVKQHEKHISSLIVASPFDLVDAINWLVMRKDLAESRLVDHSLEIINKQNFEKYANIVTKLINLVLKKINYIQWVKIRQYKSIFRFICHAYRQCRQNINIQISNCYKLTSLQLHLLGYDQIPAALFSLFDRIVENIGQIHLSNLVFAYGLQQTLPFNSFSHEKSQFLLQTILERMSREMPFLQHFPFSKMSEQEIELVVCKYRQKWLTMKVTIYFSNKIVSALANRSSFVEGIEQNFMNHIQSSKNLILTDISGVIFSSFFLFNYYNNDKAKQELIKEKFLKIYKWYTKTFTISKIIQNISLVNLFNLKFIFSQFSEEIEPGFKRFFDKGLDTFTNKKIISNWRIKPRTEQILQTIRYYKNTSNQVILNDLNRLISWDSYDIHNFSYSRAAEIIFHLQGSYNHVYFKNSIITLYSHFRNEKLLALAEYYNMFEDKTQACTSILIYKFWMKGKKFSPVGKVLAHCDILHLQENGKLKYVISDLINQRNDALQSSDIEQFSIGEIVSLLKFFRCYYHDLSLFAEKFVSEVVKYINQDKNRENIGTSPKLYELITQAILLLKANSQERQTERMNEIIKFKSNFSSISRIDQLYFEYLVSEFKNEQLQRLEREVNQGAFTTNHAKDLLKILNMNMKGILKLNENGERFIQNQIMNALKSNSIYPITIREQAQDVLFKCATEIKAQKLKMLTDVLTYSLRNIKIYQGIQFYYWCLRVAHICRAQDFILQVLKWLTVHHLQPGLILKILTILMQYPIVIHQKFVIHLINCLRYNLPHFDSSYEFLLFYLHLAFEEPPLKFKSLFAEMLTVVEQDLRSKTLILSKSRKQIYNNQFLSHYVNTAYKYFFISILNDRKSQILANVFEFCQKNKEVMKQISINGIEEDIVELIDAYLLVQLNKNAILCNKIHKIIEKIRLNTFSIGLRLLIKKIEVRISNFQDSQAMQRPQKGSKKLFKN